MKDTNKRFNTFINKIKSAEGGYVNNPNKIDQETNIGITQATLETYNARHPKADFPSNLKTLTPEQIEQIYKEFYYDDKNIADIDDDRIAFAVMDMGVMTNPKNVGYIVQDSINTILPGSVIKDGHIGPDTIAVLNNIPDDKKDVFMQTLINNRLQFLQGLNSWSTYGHGWENRTKRYLNY